MPGTVRGLKGHNMGRVDIPANHRQAVDATMGEVLLLGLCAWEGYALLHRRLPRLPTMTDTVKRHGVGLRVAVWGLLSAALFDHWITNRVLR
jgi:hypothetical protein